jgi:hypothetical protein
MRGRNQLEQASGVMPRRANTKPKRASTDAEPHVHRELHRRADAHRGTVDRRRSPASGFEDAQRDAAAAVADALVAPVHAAAPALCPLRAA